MRSPIESPPLPQSVDIAIVGAGPQALTNPSHSPEDTLEGSAKMERIVSLTS
jgi:hypothetical protein